MKVNNIEELQERFTYLVKQLDIKKLEIEKSLKDLEVICKQIQEIQKSINEIKDSAI